MAQFGHMQLYGQGYVMLFLGKYSFRRVLSIFGFESVGLDDFASELLNAYLLNTALVFNRKCKTQFQN